MSKKLLAILVVGIGVCSSLFGTSSVFAISSDGHKEITVTYDNQNTNPEAGWQVGIVRGVHFNDDKKTVNLPVELQDTNYRPNMDTNLKVKISLKSENAYDLKKGAKKVEYQVRYDSVMEKNNLKQQIGILSGGLENYRKEGTAKLLGSSNELGRFTDRLTYYVQRQ